VTEAAKLVDVADESRWRRWKIADQPTSEGWRIESGDGALTVGPGKPVRVVTLDAQAGHLEHATRRATLASGVLVPLTLTPSDDRPFGERAQALRDAMPDLVLVPLVDRDGAERLVLLAEALRFGCAAQQPRPRVIIASDDEDAVGRASTLLSPFEVEVLPDIRSAAGRERVVARLRQDRRDAGILRDEALEAIARAIAAAQGAPALVVDVTGASTSLVRAEPGGGLLAAHVRPLGVGRGADHVVARAGLERVRRWIPWAVDQPTLLERVFNRARWPDAAAAERETMALEVGLAHEAISHALADATAAGIGQQLRSTRAVFLTGRLASLAGRATPVLVAIDSLELTEPGSIARDDDDVIVAVAAAALSSAATEALAPAIAELAVALAAIVPVTARRRSAVRILSGTEVRDERVDPGALFVVPVSGEVDVAASGVAPTRLAAGAIGVIVDARRRPLGLPLRDAERVPTVAGWYGAVGAAPGDAA
jgi:hypothetical protein